MSNLLRGKESLILASIGAIGVIGTGVSAAFATPKALKKLEVIEGNRAKKAIDVLMDDDSFEDGNLLETYKTLTKFEKFCTMAPYYIPTVLIGASTIACILVAHKHNTNIQAGLISAYTLIDSTYKNYCDTNVEMFCGDNDKQIMMAMAYAEYNDIVMCDGEELFFDEYSGRYFKSTKGQVDAAIQHVNEKFKDLHYCELSEFYDYLGLEPVEYGDVVGWSERVGYTTYGYTWVHIDLNEEFAVPDFKYMTITFPFRPTADFFFYKYA